MRIESLSFVVAELESGRRPKGGVSEDSGTIPSLGGEHLNKDGGFFLDNLKYIEETFFVSLKKGTIKHNDILIVKDGATTGKVSFVGNDFPFKRAAINEHLFSLRVNTMEANPKYVFLFLKSPQGQKQILKDFRGAAIGGISRGFIDLAKIPLPLLDDQIRIAHLLSKVEGLITQRKQHLQQLDDLLKSVFLEMFGDPVRNEREWNKPELKQFGKISTGNTPPRKDSSNYATKHIEWIKTSNISADSVFVSQAVEYLSETGIIKARTVKKDALLVACIAGSVESIGRAALTDRTVAFNQQINAIQPGRDVNSLYMYTLFKISKFYIQSHASKGMKKILTKGDFEKIRMIKPPIEIQDQFAIIVEKVEGIKSSYQQSLVELENLYGALSQKAFKGEVDLSRVPLPTITGDISVTLPSLEVEAHGTVHKVPNPLPDPGDLKILASTEGRRDLIAQWLDVYLEQLDSTPFSTQNFMETAQEKLWELVEDAPTELGAAEYDQLKTWVFQALKSGRLTQSYDKDGNRVQITSTNG